VAEYNDKVPSRLAAAMYSSIDGIARWYLWEQAIDVLPETGKSLTYEASLSSPWLMVCRNLRSLTNERDASADEGAIRVSVRSMRFGAQYRYGDHVKHLRSLRAAAPARQHDCAKPAG